MNFQEAQAIMIDGDEAKMNGLRYRIKDGKLYYYFKNKNEWLLTNYTFDMLHDREWHKVPAKEYDFMEAAKLCLAGRSFNRVNYNDCIVTLEYNVLIGLNCTNTEGQILPINKTCIASMWTEVVR